MKLRIPHALAALTLSTACGGAAGGDLDDGVAPGDLAPEGVAEVTEATQVVYPTDGNRPMLVVLLQKDAATPLAHTSGWYTDRIFGRYGGRSVRSYFLENSGGAFTYGMAGVVPVVDDLSSAFATRAGVLSTDDANTRKRKRARLLAADAGFDFRPYDTNGDGKVTTTELAILAIDNYSTGSGQSGTPACTTAGGKSVCSTVALVGHRSGLMNYAQFAAYMLNPAAVAAAGTSCNSLNLTLMSCTGGGVYDSTVGYLLDPWHRDRYGWVQDAAEAGGPSGTVYVRPVGLPIDGAFETFELGGPSGEGIIFEARFRSLNDYDDGLATEGLHAWYRKVDSSRQPVTLPTPDGSTTERALFSLAPSSCRLDPMSSSSRGKSGVLESGTYRIKWATGADSGYLIRVTAGYGVYGITWSTVSTAPSCG